MITHDDLIALGFENKSYEHGFRTYCFAYCKNERDKYVIMIQFWKEKNWTSSYKEIQNTNGDIVEGDLVAYHGIETAEDLRTLIQLCKGKDDNA